MPEFALYIDEVGAGMLDIQEYNEQRNRAYYLLRDNPAVRVTVRGDDIEGCVDRVLAVIAGFEECWGQWEANAHLRGRKTYTVTIFSEDRREENEGMLSIWLEQNFLWDDAPFREAGGKYSTPTHEAKG
jgi:hypothetical protein